MRCHLFPEPIPTIRSAVLEAGAEIVSAEEAEILVHTGGGVEELAEILTHNPGIRWVQLRGAGIDRFLDLLDDSRVWTCAKGAYSDPVAEHALALTLAGMRGVVRYTSRTTWSDPYGYSLKGAKIVVLGAGGIARSLVRLLQPFGPEVTLVRRRREQVDGAKVVDVGQFPSVVEDAAAVILALALTPDTRGIVDAEILQRMDTRGWLVNVARGAHIVTSDLVEALQNDEIGGAALDVTDPEPLPDGHPLWTLPNVVITPHVGSTPDMHLPYYLERIRQNLERFKNRQPLLGVVDVSAGY